MRLCQERTRLRQLPTDPPRPVRELSPSVWFIEEAAEHFQRWIFITIVVFTARHKDRVAQFPKHAWRSSIVSIQFVVSSSDRQRLKSSATTDAEHNNSRWQPGHPRPLLSLPAFGFLRYYCHSSSSSSPPCLSRFPSKRSAENSNSAVRDTLNHQEQVSPTAVREPTTAPRQTDTGRPDRSLPPFVPISTPNFHWGNLNAEDFSHVITCASAEIVHWRRNVFMVPSGKAGKRFVQELTRLFSAYADASAMEGIAIKAVMTACSLLLQKPHSGSKSHDHATALERRLKSCEEGDLDGLMREGRTIHNHFRTNHGKRMEKADMDSHNVRSFTNLMLQGKVHSAMRFLSDNQGSGVLDLDENVDASKTVRDVLAEKHPSGREIKEEALIGNGEEPPTPHPVLF